MANELYSAFTVQKMAYLFVFHFCGLAINGYLLFRLYQAWNSSAWKSLNKVICYQLFLNVCNILSHVALEVSTDRLWVTLSTSFSFQAIYFLAAVEVSSSLGRTVQQQLNSFQNMAILTFVSTALSGIFGGRYVICGTYNCFDFSANNNELFLSAEEDKAVLNSSFAHFLAPTSAILLGSFFYGFRKYERMRDLNHTPSWTSRLARLCASSAVSLFLLYGVVIGEMMLYSTEIQETTRPRHMCRVTCLYEELYLLLSMFPVGYFAYFVRQIEEKYQQEHPKE